jgi:hypothetical protein
MGRGIFEKLEGIGTKLPDKRNTGHNSRYFVIDALQCAFGVFFFLSASVNAGLSAEDAGQPTVG